MKKRFFRTRKMRYAGVSAILSVLVIVAVILINTVFGSLATRYELVTYMSKESSYEVTSVCYGILDDAFAKASEETGKRTGTVEILFCDSEETWIEDVTQSYLYHTAKTIAARYGDRIQVSFHDIYLNPNTVRQYAKDPETGEKATLSNTDVIIACEDYFRVYELEEFFVFTDLENTQVNGYNGERKLAAGILRAINRTPQTAYLTGNHGEFFYDYELIYLLDDAGYRIESDLDLAAEEIPADCSLLITYNPNSDLDFSEGIAEDDKLDRYLSQAGKSYLVFLSNGTPLFSNLESYLNEWGVRSMKHTDTSTGKEYRYTVQDTAQSLTSDGYTIYGHLSGQSTAGTWFASLEENVVFKNTTAMTHATDYAPTGTGAYRKGDRTLYSIYEASESALLWANGVSTGGKTPMLMSITEQKNDAGSSYVGVVSSIDLVRMEQTQSAVLDNPDVAQRLFSVFGQENTTEGLKMKPFATDAIATITTAQMLRWTLGLAIIPTAVVALVGVVLLVKRRHA